MSRMKSRHFLLGTLTVTMLGTGFSATAAEDNQYSFRPAAPSEGMQAPQYAPPQPPQAPQRMAPPQSPYGPPAGYQPQQQPLPMAQGPYGPPMGGQPMGPMPMGPGPMPRGPYGPMGRQPMGPGPMPMGPGPMSQGPYGPMGRQPMGPGPMPMGPGPMSQGPAGMMAPPPPPPPKPPVNRGPGSRGDKVPLNRSRNTSSRGNSGPSNRNRSGPGSRGNSGPWNKGPWGGGRGGSPWGGRGQSWSPDSWFDDRKPLFGKKGPSEWFNRDDYKEGLEDMWDDLLNSPSNAGQMPGGWYAPTISIPNPVEVGDEFENSMTDVPNQARDQLENFSFDGRDFKNPGGRPPGAPKKKPASFGTKGGKNDGGDKGTKSDAKPK